MARRPGYAVVDIVGGHALGRAGKPALLIRPGSNSPVVRRAGEGARVGGDELGHDGSWQPLETEVALLSIGVVGTPCRIADHGLLVQEHGAGLVENHTVLR